MFSIELYESTIVDLSLRLRKFNTVKFAILSISVLISTWSVACPLGAKENHLTIQRIMRNFGRFIMPAEMISVRSQNKTEVITDAQLEDAILKLNHVVSCAQAVVDNPTGDLIPMAARLLPEKRKATYIEDLVFYMDEFKELVKEYQNLFIEVSAKPAAARNFEAIQNHTKLQNAMIDHAHEKLMPD